MITFMLNGQWELTYSDIGDKDKKWGRWIPATVPGDVHLDLVDARLLPEPLVSDNSKKCKWVEEKDWWYKKQFHISEEFITNKVEIVFEGLDLTADVWLNGHAVGMANNMFIQHRFDITEYLKAGDNELLVRIDVGVEATKGKPFEPYISGWNKIPERPLMRKAQQAFVWDHAPRLITCGIWRDVTIESFDEATLRDLYISSKFDGKKAVISIQVETEVFSPNDGIYSISATIRDEKTNCSGNRIVKLKTGINVTGLEIEMDSPKLWWPNGMGDQNLYDIQIELMQANGAARTLCTRNLKYGIRTIEIEKQPINENEKTFTFVVNGKRVFCKGANWVPSDAIYARATDSKDRKLLKLAHEANFNMLRVWGGGIYEDKGFLEACDEFGIMIWQDFMFACSYYPGEDPAFCEEVKHEAETVVKKYRNHPSLALWNGNNEVTLMHNKNYADKPFYGKNLFDEIIAEVCSRLDPYRAYQPSSPYPSDSEPDDSLEGDQHVWEYSLGLYLGKPKAMQLYNYTENNHKFISEFGLFGPSNLSSMKKYLGEHPVIQESEIWNHHRNYFEANFINTMLKTFYKDKDKYELDEFIMAGQMAHAEITKYIIEEFRSRMYTCSGTLFWDYNDTWGYTGFAVVDYYLSIKPIYYYMRRMFSPVHVVFKDNGEKILLLNDTPNPRKLSVEYGCMTFAGEKLFSKVEKVDAEPNSSLPVASLADELKNITERDTVFVYANVFNGSELVDRNRQFLVPIKQLIIPASTMEYSVAKKDDCLWEVSLSSRQFVWMVKITTDDAYKIDDNAFDLWPGEVRKVLIKTDKPTEELELTIENMNNYFNLK